MLVATCRHLQIMTCWRTKKDDQRRDGVGVLVWMRANQNFFRNGRCPKQHSKTWNHTRVMRSSQLVFECSRWWPENTVGHSRQRKTKRNTKTPRNPKVKLSTSTKMKKVRKPKSPKPSSGLMTWKNFLGTLETPRKRRIGETRPEAQNTLKTWTSVENPARLVM